MGKEEGKIALLSGELSGRASSYYTLTLAREMLKRGIEIQLVCAGGKLKEEFRQIGVPTLELRRIAKRFLWRFAKRPILSHLHKSRPQILHAQTTEVSLLGAKISARLRIPLIVTVHGGVMGHWKLRALRRRRTRVIAVSEPLREDLVNIVKVPKERITVIPNGLDLTEYEVAEPFAGNGTPVVGIIGPLVSIKGHDAFLRAAREILRYAPDAQFVIAGEGPEEWNLRRLAHQLGIQKNVTFAVGITDYKALLKTIDIFVFPSLEEGFGYNVLEAMATGKPVVASSAGGLYSVVRDGETGFLVERGDFKAIANKVLSLIRDPSKAREMGMLGRKVVEEEFDIRVIVDKTLAVYHEALGETEQ